MKFNNIKSLSKGIFKLCALCFLILLFLSPGSGLANSCCEKAEAKSKVESANMDKMSQGNNKQMKHMCTMADGNMGDMGRCHNIKGIPNWMFFSGVAMLLLVTAGFTGLQKTMPLMQKNSDKSSFDLLSIGWISRTVKKPWFPILIQGPVVLLFLFIIIAGLAGARHTNIAPVFTWTIWWGILVFIVLFFGKAFCAVCPWDALAGIFQRASLFRQRRAIFTRNIPWPKWARNIYPATLLFIGLTWLELGFGVTRNAPVTAVLGLLMLALAVICAMTFSRRSFCRYGCLIGRISGLYAMFSPIELRSRKKATCDSCRTLDCSKGNEAAMGCPTFEFPGKLSRSTYCTLCTECVRACPSDNIGIFPRKFGKDLYNERKFQKDEANLAVVLLALTSFHGLTMTPTWYTYTDWVQAFFNTGYKTAFSILMLACILLPMLLFWGVAWSSDFITKRKLGVSYVFRAFAFPLIPIALCYHVAHNVMHFFREGQFVIPLLSDPFGWGWNLFGTAKLELSPLLSLGTIWYLQTFLILTGHIYGIYYSDRISRMLFKEPKKAWAGQFPMLLVMILFSLYSLWLIHQPMEMRSGL
jgi:ferredoxin